MPEKSLFCTQIFSASPIQSNTKTRQSQVKTHKNHRFIAIAHLCDRLLFDYGDTLSEFETTILAAVAGRYRGNASPKELAIISKCAGRVGLQMGGNI